MLGFAGIVAYRIIVVRVWLEAGEKCFFMINFGAACLDAKALIVVA